MKSVSLTSLESTRFKNITKQYKHQKPHQYEDVRIKDHDVFFVLYNSGKLVYNENSSTQEILSKILIPKQYEDDYKTHNNKVIVDNSTSITDNYQSTIGTDETGKGEWFGPLVITGVCTSSSQNRELKDIGVKDSKKLNNSQINNLYKKIKQLDIKEQTIILKPFSYNNLYKKYHADGKNLNHLLAYLHSKVITQLLSTINTTDVLVIIDKFDTKKMNEALNINDKIKVIQESNGEKYIPVATSSIIAKYHYEQTLKEIEERYNISNLRKIKPSNIDKDVLERVAKTHFKNIKPYVK